VLDVSFPTNSAVDPAHRPLAIIDVHYSVGANAAVARAVPASAPSALSVGAGSHPAAVAVPPALAVVPAGTAPARAAHPYTTPAPATPAALAACVVASDWPDASSLEEHTTLISSAAPYKPGAFFERELPCILQVLALVQRPLGVVVVDGYVELDEHGAPGLGGHLYSQLGGRIAVVGIAKTSYRGSAFAEHVLRGTSKRPLFVTARGLSASQAAKLVQQMHGANRIPTLVTRVDHHARGLVSPART
jgi:deoxyribonuclease V